jgi:DNA repair protein RadD
MKLRPYQQEALDSVKQSLKQQLNPIVEIPTGGGKSIVIAKLAEYVSQFPDYRVLILAHRKKLIEQNAEKIDGDVGVYSAGLGVKDTDNNVIVGGIQSVYNKDLGDFKLIIIDECHLLSPKDDSMYQQLIAKHPDARVVGFSATPYRTDSDSLPVFTHTCYNIGIGELINQGYLCPLVSKVPKINADFKNVPIKMGDFVESKLAEVMLEPKLLKETIAQLLPHLKERRSCLIFCVNVDHVEIVTQALRDNLINADCVHSKMSKAQGDLAIDLFMQDQTHVLVNCDILTTGFDAPNIDMIAMFKATESRTLYVQMVGRGTRLHPDKDNCLVLDFVGNINRHGPVTNLIPSNKKISRKNDETTEGFTHRICPMCLEVNSLQEPKCIECGFELKQKRIITHDNKPADIDILGDGGKWYNIVEVFYDKHEKKGKPPSLKVTYISTSDEFPMWHAVNSTSQWAKNKAIKWCMDNCMNFDGFIDLDNISQYKWREPSRIRVVNDGKYKRVSAYEFED